MNDGTLRGKRRSGVSFSGGGSIGSGRFGAKFDGSKRFVLPKREVCCATRTEEDAGEKQQKMKEEEVGSSRR